MPEAKRKLIATAIEKWWRVISPATSRGRLINKGRRIPIKHANITTPTTRASNGSRTWLMRPMPAQWAKFLITIDPRRHIFDKGLNEALIGNIMTRGIFRRHCLLMPSPEIWKYLSWHALRQLRRVMPLRADAILTKISRTASLLTMKTRAESPWFWLSSPRLMAEAYAMPMLAGRHCVASTHRKPSIILACRIWELYSIKSISKSPDIMK